MEQQLSPASWIHQQVPCLQQQQQQSQTGSGARSNSRYEQVEAVSKDKATFVILVGFDNVPSALQMMYGFISYMLWLAKCALLAYVQRTKICI